jgi:hypothetical protein
MVGHLIFSQEIGVRFSVELYKIPIAPLKRAGPAGVIVRCADCALKQRTMGAVRRSSSTGRASHCLCECCRFKSDLFRQLAPKSVTRSLHLKYYVFGTEGMGFLLYLSRVASRTIGDKDTSCDMD